MLIKNIIKFIFVLSNIHYIDVSTLTKDKDTMKNPEMISRVINKKETQQMIKALRDAKLPIKKIESGYELKTKDDIILFKAMIGSNGYLVRYAKELFI